MKKCLLLTLLVAGFMMSSVKVVPAIEAPGTCKDIPLRITLYNNAVTDPETNATIPSALRSDGGGEYINGVSTSALIKVCGGTNDAVLNVASTKRRFRFVFPEPIPGSVINDSLPFWVPGNFLVSGWINVRNITFSKLAFTTRMGSTFTPSVERATYRLGFHPYQAEAPDLHSGETLADLDNTPYETSPAMVYPNYPVTASECGTGNMPSWLVRGTTRNGRGMMEVATLHKKLKNGSQVHNGQYTMPFEMRIEAMQCFPY